VNVEVDFCFGKEYSEEDSYCRICDVRKECKEAMQSGERRVVEIQCFGEYGGPPSGDNYACKVACQLAEKCKEVTLARMAKGQQPDVELVIPEKELPIPEIVVSEEVAPKLQRIMEEPPAEPVVEGKASPIPGRPSKKGIVRQALKSNAGTGGISADNIVQLMVDAGLVKDTDEERAKNRDYVSMCISELRKQEGMVVVRDGDKYVLSD